VTHTAITSAGRFAAADEDPLFGEPGNSAVTSAFAEADSLQVLDPAWGCEDVL
jgi:hypothetical protein